MPNPTHETAASSAAIAQDPDSSFAAEKKESDSQNDVHKTVQDKNGSRNNMREDDTKPPSDESIKESLRSNRSSFEGRLQQKLASSRVTSASQRSTIARVVENEIEQSSISASVGGAAGAATASENQIDQNISVPPAMAAAANGELDTSWVDDDQNDIQDEDHDRRPSSDEPIKESRRSNRSSIDSSVGAEQMEGPAPNINRRTFNGLARRKRKTGGATGGGGGGLVRSFVRPRVSFADDIENEENNNGNAQDNGDNEEVTNGDTPQRAGVMRAIVRTLTRSMESGRGEVLISATLVEEDDVQIVEAQEVKCYHNVKLISLALCFGLTLLAVLLGVFVTRSRRMMAEMPSEMPSSMPTFDDRPTLGIVRDRGYVRCGRGEWSKGGDGGDFYMDLCRSIAAVVFGDPSSVEEVIVTGSNRFDMLLGRSVDVLLYGDTHTLEREINEKTTGSGFTFSSPYYYDGLTYFGNATLVDCAERRQRYDECESLLICTYRGSTTHTFLLSHFPSDFLNVGESLVEAENMLSKGECNVLAANRGSLLLHVSSNGDNYDPSYIVGQKLQTNEPYAAVTRNDNPEWSDVVNWVIQALFYGEEQGLTKDATNCMEYDALNSVASELQFLNAPNCVGNYGEIYNGDDRGPNQLNDGSTGMLYVIPFGEINRDIDGVSNTRLHDLRNARTLKCGLAVNEENNSIADLDAIRSLSLDYCQTVSAALFNGKYDAVTIETCSGEKCFVALNNGSVDILSGLRIENQYDFARSSTFEGFRFSVPFFYGNETTDHGEVSFFALATRDSDVIFSSFVNMVIVSTFYAMANAITSETSIEMPLVSLFGHEFTWSLRDGIGFSGSYNELFTKHFGDSVVGTRGRNDLNDDGSPQILPFPGLSGETLVKL